MNIEWGDVLWTAACLVAAGAAVAGVALLRWWQLRRSAGDLLDVSWTQDTDCLLAEMDGRAQARREAAIDLGGPIEPDAVRRQRATLESERARRDNPDTVAMIRGWPAPGSSSPMPLGWSNFGPGPGVGPNGERAGARRGRRPQEAATQY